MALDANIKSRYETIEGIALHYLEAGEGKPILLIHGWPTSSFLWRNIIPSLASGNRVIAIDLPGFGKSDKPLEASYNFPFYEKLITKFLNKLGIGKTSLAVHDLGGPIGLYWLCQNMEMVNKLVLLNTLVYPELSFAVKAFVAACSLPLVRDALVSEIGLEIAMRFGVANPFSLDGEAIRGYQEPFKSENAKKALLKAGLSLSPKGIMIIANRLPQFKGEVQIIYGEQDRILPDVADTMKRVKKDLPQAQMISLPNSGHFLQEDAPVEIGLRMSEFLGK